MNQTAMERIITILLAEIDSMQSELTTMKRLIDSFHLDLDLYETENKRLEAENKRLVTEPTAFRKNVATIVPYQKRGRPKGSKNKPKVVA
jgi:hypothetical protein